MPRKEGLVSEWGKQYGQGNWINVDNSTPKKWRSMVNPTAMIVFRDEEKRDHNMCTGFLVGRQTFLTAGHCDALEVCRRNYDELGAEHYRVRFNYHENTEYREYGVKEIKGFYHCPNTGDNFDYSIFKLKSTAAADKYGVLELQTQYRAAQPIAIAHHPDGMEKKVSQGLITRGYKHNGLFGHTADTLRGSSGAPVVSINSGKVVGIHVQGGSNENYAVPCHHFVK